MSDIYNSELISKLYNSTDYEDAKNILGDMEEINSPVFVRPIYDAFLKFKSSPISHYFLSTLKKFDNPEVLEIAQEVVDDPKEKRNFFWAVPILTKFNSFREKDILICQHVLKKVGIDPNLSDVMDFDVKTAIDFLMKGKNEQSLIPILESMITRKVLSKEIRSTVLVYLFKIDSKNTFNFLLKNFSTFDGELQIIISKQLNNWNGFSKSIALRNLISITGVPRAKEIISENEKKEEKDQSKKNEINFKNDFESFSNAKLIKFIVTLRNEINMSALGSEMIGCELLDSYEDLILQIEIVRDFPSLKDSVLNLRSCLTCMGSKIPDQKNTDISILDGIGLKIRPDECNKPINKICIFLASKGIKVDGSLFGMRNIQNFANKLAAHGNENKSDLIKAIKELGLFDLYNSQDWETIHREILLKYQKSLEGLKDSIFKK